jgi:hypothetical protein
MRVERGRPETNPLLRLSQLGQSVADGVAKFAASHAAVLAGIDTKAGALAVP